MSSNTATLPIVSDARTRTSWGAVLIMTATSFALVTGEFLPPSLLPAMAASLGITEGQAGQTVTVTAFAGLIAAPTIGILFPRVERRTLLSILAVAAVVSNIAVALSGSIVILLVARLLLGAAIGGFWAMSLAVAARLSSPQRLGRAVMLVTSGGTLATVVGVPAGIFLGALFDWRVVFAGLSVVMLVVAAALRLILPDVPPAASSGIRSLGVTLRTPGIAWGLAGHVLTVLGHFAAFTYIRSALALDPDLDAGGAATLIVAFGVGAVAGNFATGAVVDRHLRVLRFVVPFLIAAGIAAVVAFPGQLAIVGVAVVVWGMGFGGWLTVVTTWIGRVAPSRMESGGGLVVAGFQLAIMLGAAVGGVVVDTSGVATTLILGAAAAVLGGILFGTARQSVAPATAATPIAGPTVPEG